MKRLDNLLFDVFANGCKASQYASGKTRLQDIVEKFACDNPVDQLRKGNKDIKKSIAAFCPMGSCKTNVRKIAEMEPNGLGMFDLDHLHATHQEIADAVASLPEKVRNSFALLYITCSGDGLRAVFPLYKDKSIIESALLQLRKSFPQWMRFLDCSTTDISRLSILTAKADYLYVAPGDMEIQPQEMNFDEQGWIDMVLRKHGSVPDFIKFLHEDDKAADMIPASEEGEAAEGKQPSNGTTDVKNRPYKSYTDAEVEENDRLYAGFTFKGRRVSDIAEAYVLYKTHGRGPEAGERHILYGTMCRNFRNLVDNNPLVLHAVLPQMTKGTAESWQQVCYYTAKNQTTTLPKDFYFWLKDRGFLEFKEETDEDEDETPETKMYNEFLNSMPSMPPVIREYLKIAPKWFKLPTLTTLQCYLGLLCTNHRATYYDGSTISTSLYSIVYAPAGSGKSYIRKLRTLLKDVDQRDKLALEKANWYDRQQRQNNGSGKLPEEIEWKQQLFASKTSLGEILRRQKALGPHHFLQDVAEFDIWAATIKKNKEEWSAFFRTSYENDEFSQSFQSANAFRGKVPVYPIVHATCTLGQIKKFFTNVEDGLLTRFSFVPLLNQQFAPYQPWKVMTDADQARVEKVLRRLQYDTYEDVTFDVDDADEDTAARTDEDGNDTKEWDYSYKPLIMHDMQYLNDAILNWMEEQRLTASKAANDALDQFRKRVARNAFIFGLICRALWGNNRKETQQKVINAALWDANVKMYYMRTLWEKEVIRNNQLEVAQRSKIQIVSVYDSLPAKFTKQSLENALMAQGYTSQASCILSNWKSGGFITKLARHTYQKTIVADE